jgi:outer membrane protein OmpA-like peptidoglycan-associated protein
LKETMLRLLCILLFCLLMTGCGSKRTTFVLLQDPGGTVGKISVTNEKGTQTLKEAGQSVVINSYADAPGDVKPMEEAKIQSLFGKALKIRPSQPTKFRFYFKFDSVELESGSTKVLQTAVQTAKDQDSKDISINGHTDRSGNEEYNYKLSWRRAMHIQNLLEEQGIDPTFILTTSHGEGNPLVPTADNVFEPRNRRVEVIIR